MDKQDIRDEIKKKKFDAERAEALSQLVRQDGWSYYVDLLNAKISDRTSSLLEPVADGMALASEHNKGAVYGLIYARDLPSVIIAAHNEMKKSSDPTEEEHDDDN